MLNRNGLFFLLLSFLLSGCMPIHWRQASEINSFQQKQHNQLRVASYGVVTDLEDWPFNNPKATAKAIQIINPDILLVQETTPTWKKDFKKYFSKQFPYQESRLHINHEGLEVLSKYPIHSQAYIDGTPSNWYPAWIVSINTPIGKIQFLNVHLYPTFNPSSDMRPPDFPKYSIFKAGNVRKAEMMHYLAYLNTHKDFVISGDFNEGDHGKANLYLKSLGFKDAAVLSHTFTWHWYVIFIRITNRFDHMYYSPQGNIVPIRVQVPHIGGSDHYPLVVDFIKIKKSS